MPGKPWKEAGRSHLATAVRVEGSSSTVVRILGMNRSPQASRLRERAKAVRRTARGRGAVDRAGIALRTWDQAAIMQFSLGLRWLPCTKRVGEAGRSV